MAAAEDGDGEARTMRRLLLRAAAVAAAAGVGSVMAAAPAVAHPFVEPYRLPVPVSLYLIGAVATLVLSFAVIGYFVTAPASAPTYRAVVAPSFGSVRGRLAGAVLATLRVAAVGALLLTFVAGSIGSSNPLQNVSMTLFWIVFVLGLTYLTAVIGDVYALLNPWRTVVDWLDGPGFDLSRSRVAYPAFLGYYPALVLYVALIWVELFGDPAPSSLSRLLLGYTVLTFAGVWVFGKAAWFRHGEVFSVFLRLVGTLAPVEYDPDPQAGRPWGVRLRVPFSGVLKEPADHPSLVVFVLFMLSSTTYDGIRGTVLWDRLFWQHLWSVIEPFWGVSLVEASSSLMPWFVAYQRAGLVLSPVVYLALYLGILWWARKATGSTLPLRTLALQFAFTLIPIAFVYHVTHYFTMLLQQWPYLPWLFTDPFGFGWNLFGLGPAPEQTPLGMGVIWHIQVVLIVAGHIASVYLAHLVAIRLFPGRRHAVASQVPMLLLMVGYTAVGLWVLSLPLATAG